MGENATSRATKENFLNKLSILGNVTPTNIDEVYKIVTNSNSLFLYLKFSKLHSRMSGWWGLHYETIEWLKHNAPKWKIVLLLDNENLGHVIEPIEFENLESKISLSASRQYELTSNYLPGPPLDFGGMIVKLKQNTTD